MKKEKKAALSYESAFAELQTLIAEIQDENTAIDHLADKIGRARELISFCRDKLRKTEEEVDKLLDQS